VSLPLPYGLSSLNWIHIGIVPFVTVPLSIFMVMVLFRRNHPAKRIAVSCLGLVLLFSLVLFVLHFEGAGVVGSSGITVNVARSAISFDGFALLAVMISCWGLSAVPFIWKFRHTSAGSEKSKRANYALLASSVMWLSPFFAELLVFLDWGLRSVFAGGNSKKIKLEAAIKEIDVLPISEGEISALATSPLSYLSADRFSRCQ
jgi:hypothetical protein